jgi:hypothetical protein
VNGPAKRRNERKKTVITREGFFQIQELNKNLLNYDILSAQFYYVTYLRLGGFCCLFYFLLLFFVHLNWIGKPVSDSSSFVYRHNVWKLSMFSYIFCTIIELWTLFTAADPLNIAFQIDLAQKFFFSEGAHSYKQMQAIKEQANLSCDSDP